MPRPDPAAVSRGIDRALAEEERRLAELVRRLRRLADPGSMGASRLARRRAAAAMEDAAATIVDYALGGEEPG